DTCTHQAIIGVRDCPLWEPDERHVNQVPQSDFLQLRERVSLGNGQNRLGDAYLEVRQTVIRVRKRNGEAGVKRTGLNRGNLLKRGYRPQLQFNVWAALPKILYRIWNDPMPGNALKETDAQRAGQAGSDAFCAGGCVIDLLKNAARIIKK